MRGFLFNVLIIIFICMLSISTWEVFMPDIIKNPVENFLVKLREFFARIFKIQKK